MSYVVPRGAIASCRVSTLEEHERSSPSLPPELPFQRMMGRASLRGVSNRTKKGRCWLSFLGFGCFPIIFSVKNSEKVEIQTKKAGKMFTSVKGKFCSHFNDIT